MDIDRVTVRISDAVTWCYAVLVDNAVHHYKQGKVIVNRVYMIDDYRTEDDDGDILALVYNVQKRHYTFYFFISFLEKFDNVG